jgi:hypothetical protein
VGCGDACRTSTSLLWYDLPRALDVSAAGYPSHVNVECMPCYNRHDPYRGDFTHWLQNNITTVRKHRLLWD